LAQTGKLSLASLVIWVTILSLLPDQYDRYYDKFTQIGATILFGLIIFDVLPIGKTTFIIYNNIYHLLGI